MFTFGREEGRRMVWGSCLFDRKGEGRNGERGEGTRVGRPVAGVGGGRSRIFCMAERNIFC